jgi:transcriptional regulator with XRE-family HTH domain
MGAARVETFSPAALRCAREAARLTQVGLGAAIGSRKQAIWRLERGHRKPSPRTLHQLAQALDVEPVALTTAATAPALGDLRQVAGFTQAELAEQLGISEDRWAAIERGARPAGDELASQAATALGATPEAFAAAWSRAGSPAAVRSG